MDDSGEKRIVVNGVIVTAKPREMKKLVRDLLGRVAAALEAGELPTVKDAADLQLLVLEYWEKDKEPRGLGLKTRAANRQCIGTLKREEIQSVIDFCVGRKKPDKGELFAALIQLYLKGDITASDLLGERGRKPRLGHVWQYRDQLGELAERVHRQLRDSQKGGNLLTGNRSLLNRLNNNFYELLSELSFSNADVKVIQRRYKLSAQHVQTLEDVKDALTSINKEFDVVSQGLSSSVWRDCHLEFKNSLTQLHPF